MGLWLFLWRNPVAQAVLPYALVVIGLWAACETVPRVLKRQEAEATPVPLAHLRDGDPAQQWLKLTGGGLYVARAVGEYKGLRGQSLAIRYYIPLLTPAEANAWTAAGGQPPKGTKKLMLARLTSEQYTSLFGNAPAVRGRREYYRMTDVTGTRGGFVSSKVRSFIRSNYAVDPDGITMFDFEGKPLTPDDAFTMLVVSVAMIVGGGVWIGLRLKEGVPDSDDIYVPPVPEMPAGGWNAPDYRKSA